MFGSERKIPGGSRDLRQGNMLSFGVGSLSSMSALKLLFPKKSPLPYNDIEGYNRRMDRLVGVLKAGAFDKLLVRSFAENVRIFGVDKTLYGLMDYVCVKSLGYHSSPAGNYFDMTPLPVKLRHAGWREEDIAGVIRLISPVKALLDEYFMPHSERVEMLNLEIRVLTKGVNELNIKLMDKKMSQEMRCLIEKQVCELQNKKDELAQEREEVLSAYFRKNWIAVYEKILKDRGITSKEKRKALAMAILQVLYAQRNLGDKDTLGADIKLVYSRTNEAIKEMSKIQAGPVSSSGEKGPIIISMLSDGEILAYVQKILFGNETAKMFMISRKMLLTDEEWRKLEEAEKSKGPENPTKLLDSGHVYSTLFSKVAGRKGGIFIYAYTEAYNYAQGSSGVSQEEFMTYFMMRHTELVLKKREEDALFKKATDKLIEALVPYISRTENPLIFSDTGLKGTFPSLLASLVEIYRRQRGQDSIFSGKRNVFGFIYSIDENYDRTFPHITEGRNNCRLIESAPRFGNYERSNSRYGITLNEPAQNLLALIYYGTFLDVANIDSRFNTALHEPDAMSLEILRQLIPQDYSAGLYHFSEIDSGTEIPDPSRFLKRVDQTLEELPVFNPDEADEKRKKIGAFNDSLEKVNVSALTSLELIEAVLRLQRYLFGRGKESVKSKDVDPFRSINADTNNGALKICGDVKMPGSVSEWLITLAVANYLEVYGQRFKEWGFGKVREYIEKKQEYKLAIDSSDLFEEKIMRKPQNIAFFTDNAGEVVFDLLWVMQLARHYAGLAGAREWTIGIIPKEYPSKNDATYDMISALINAEGSPFAELRAFISEGKVKIIKGGAKSQGVNMRTLSNEAGAYLLKVQESKGHIISKGVANFESLSKGVNIPAFYVFASKAKWMEKILGVKKDGLVVAYVPAGIKAIEGTVTGVRQSLKDLQEALHSDKYLKLIESEGGEEAAIAKIKERMASTNEIFIDAISISSGKPLHNGRILSQYVYPILQICKEGEYLPIFIARAATPFKYAYDKIRARLSSGKASSIPASSGVIPKITMLGRYSLSSQIRQFVSGKELSEKISRHKWEKLLDAFRSLDAETRDAVQKELGFEFTLLKGKTVVEILDLIADIGLGEEIYRRLELNKKLEADAKKSPQDKDPSIREELKRSTKEYKNNTQHLVRPILNVLLEGTSFSAHVRSHRVAFVDEVGSVGNTVIAAEYILKAFNGSIKPQDWKFVTVQPVEGGEGIYDGNCGMKVKPLENTPQILDYFFLPDFAHSAKKQIGERFSYKEAMLLLEQRLKKMIDYQGLYAGYIEALKVFAASHHDRLMESTKVVTSRQIFKAVKYVLRQRRLAEAGLGDRDALMDHAITLIDLEEREVPNHTKRRYDFRSDIKSLISNIDSIFTENPQVFEELNGLDMQVKDYDEIFTLYEWIKMKNDYYKEIEDGINKLTLAETGNIQKKYGL